MGFLMPKAPSPPAPDPALAEAAAKAKADALKERLAEEKAAKEESFARSMGRRGQRSLLSGSYVEAAQVRPMLSEIA
jgi:hypothetical protein